MLIDGSTGSTGKTIKNGNLRKPCRQGVAEARKAEFTYMDYFGARFYVASVGRFMNPDPVLLTKRRLLQPSTLNLYIYANNTPLRYTDPTGMDSMPIFFNTFDEIPIDATFGDRDFMYAMQELGCSPLMAANYIYMARLMGFDPFLMHPNMDWGIWINYSFNVAYHSADLYATRHAELMYETDTPTGRAHEAAMLSELSTFAQKNWGISVTPDELSGWIVREGANRPYWSGGNLNFSLIKPEFGENESLTAIRGYINQDARTPGMKSLHFHPAKDGFAHFHVDTFCGSFFRNPGIWLMHVLWDGFVGTVFYDVTGLPWR